MFSVEKIKPTIERPATIAGLTAFEGDIAAIDPNYGGDCPELAFTGMLNGLNKFPQQGSSMFVFPDASPKDASPANVNGAISK